MASQLVEKREELAHKRSEFADLIAKYETEPMPDDVMSDLKARKADLEALVNRVSDLQALHVAAEDARKASAVTPPMPGGAGETKAAWQPKQHKPVEQILSESKAYADFVANNGGKVTLDLPLLAPERKAVVNLTMIDLAPDLAPGFVPYAVQRPMVGDLMLQGSTSNNTIQYYEQTTRTNDAAPVAEEGEKPESDWAMTLRTDPVEVVATWMPATRQALSDLPWLESAIREDLTAMIKEEEETQLISGDGTSPNISGILDRTGIQTEALGANDRPTAIYNAITKVRSIGFAEPTGVVMHPNDWAQIVTLKTADGIYIWGNPAMAPNDRIWGLPVVVTTGITEGTAIVGAFRPFAKRIRREDVTVTISTEHSDFFIKNKVAILAEERLALQVTRPAAFCTVTGL